MHGLEYVSDPPGYNSEDLNYCSIDARKDLSHIDGIKDGINAGSEVGLRPDGTKVYVKNVDDSYGDTVQSHVAASIVLDHLDIQSPEIAYDDLFGKIMIEEVPGDRVLEVGEERKDSFHRAAAQKLLMGDTDYLGNFLETETDVSPIDYDTTGRDLETSRRTLYTAYGEIIDDDLLNKHASKLSNSIELSELESDLREEEWLQDEWSNEAFKKNDEEVPEKLFIGSIDNILEIVDYFQR